MTQHPRTEEINELSHEEGLRELARDLRSPRRRINLREYFQLLEWGELFTCLPSDGSWTTFMGCEIQGAYYGLLFTTEEDAAASAAGTPFVPKRVRVRHMLERLEDGWGVIIDYGSDAEVRISPDELTQENERIRIKPVRQEATDSWLAETNEVLKGQGIPRDQRATEAKVIWKSLNGFRVLAGSKRARRMEWYFDVVADATANEARERCATLWRDAYALDPYLRHLDAEDLQRRLASIRTNSLLNRPTLPHELDEREWLELHEHVRYEYERRGLVFTETIPVAERLAAWPRLDIARKAFDQYRGPKGQCFRFGKAKHLEPMLSDGIIRVSSADIYDNDRLLPAQRDNELVRTVLLDASRMQITHKGADGIARPIRAVGKMEVTAKAGNNCYLWFVTTTFDPRLFDDFGVDACLIIHDMEKFLKRIYSAMAAVLPDWDGCSTLVHYFDPVRPGDAVLSPFDKDFNYAYQREFRFLWDTPVSQRTTAPLPPVYLRLGNLEDIATILKL